jgi:hypothetical protein
MHEPLHPGTWDELQDALDLIIVQRLQDLSRHPQPGDLDLLCVFREPVAERRITAAGKPGRLGWQGTLWGFSTLSTVFFGKYGFVLLHTQEVTGSSPVAPTIQIKGCTPIPGATPIPEHSYEHSTCTRCR